MQWTILGAGAVGSLLATHLQRSGQMVSLLDTRQPHRHQAKPMLLEQLDGAICMCELDCIGYQDLAHIDCLLVTTKVWQVTTALQPLIGLLPDSCPIVLLHNGMGTAEWLINHFPNNPLLAGVTSCGALKRDIHHIQHTGFGETWLGALNHAGNEWQRLVAPLANALGHAAWSEHIEERQWQKLVVNAVINPLSAVYNQPNGILLQHQAEVAALCDELQPLLVHHGLTKTAQAWCELVLQVAERTAQNYSSMQQDLANQRPTEIDFITGYLLQQAAKIDLELPLHRALYIKIKALESLVVSQ
jgi:2-dehydropantoate 2-reductase